MNAQSERDRAVDQLLRRSLTGDTTTATPACLDADTLAAFVDGGLDEGARASVIAHASICARCQALFAAMARTEEAHAATSQSRRWRLRWLVPLSAAAAAATLWMVVPDRREDVTARPVTPPAQTEPPAPAPLPVPGAPGPEQALKAPLPQADTTRENRERAAERRAQPPTIARAPSVEPPAATASAPAPPPPPPAALAHDTAGRRAIAGQTAGRVEESLKVEQDVPPLEIVSTDPRVRWRLSDREINYTTDGGATWQPIASPVVSSWTSGSAPSATVCWVVGRGGLVVRTTDGRNWTQVPFPEPVDLTTIIARDARTATITTRDGRVFATSDGGRTWSSRGPLQDFPAPPF